MWMPGGAHVSPDRPYALHYNYSEYIAGYKEIRKQPVECDVIPELLPFEVMTVSGAVGFTCMADLQC